MKFEPLASPNENPHNENAPSSCARFTLEAAPFAGQAFAVAFRVCENPVCPCGAVGFECHSQPPTESPLRFDLDVFLRQINTQVRVTPAGAALGRAFVAEAQEAQWEGLRRFFLATKHRQMETMNLDTLVVDLPADVMSGEATMVAYREIFPWADSFRFTRVGEEWLVDDQHCVQPGCGCTETALAFFRVPTGNVVTAEPLQCVTLLYHDYVTGKTSVRESHRGSLAPGDLMSALHSSQPDLVPLLRVRHKHLQQLGRRLLPKLGVTASLSVSPLLGNALQAGREGWQRQPPLPPLSRAPGRPGRNDPCPCGSGKKFKKCCGAA